MRMDELGAGSEGSMSSSTPTAVGGGESPAYPPLSEVSSLRNEYSEESAPPVLGVQGCPYNALKSRVCGGKLDIVVGVYEKGDQGGRGGRGITSKGQEESQADNVGCIVKGILLGHTMVMRCKLWLCHAEARSDFPTPFLSISPNVNQDSR